MNILALDQATTTGYAIVDDTGRILHSGTVELADKKRTGESRGMRYIRMENFLRNTIPFWNIRLVCHEQTLLRGGAATEIANGLKAIILKVATEKDCDVTCVHTCELKKWATGSGKAEKPAMIKAAAGFMTDQNAREGICKASPVDDNEADAVLIGLWAASKYGAFPAPQFETKKKAPKKRSSGRKKNDSGMVQGTFGF